jgi:hypothetical protein
MSISRLPAALRRDEPLAPPIHHDRLAAVPARCGANASLENGRAGEAAGAARMAGAIEGAARV